MLHMNSVDQGNTDKNLTWWTKLFVWERKREILFNDIHLYKVFYLSSLENINS